MAKIHHPKEAVCVTCGSAFLYTWPQAKSKFCSKTCRQKDYVMRHAEQIKNYNDRYRVERADIRKESLRKYHAGKGRVTAAQWRDRNWDRLKEELNKRYVEDPEYRGRQLSRMKAHRLLINSGIKRECSGCGSVKRLHCHHINENPFDNALTNLMWLCHWCHMRVHAESRSGK
jgi:hypothetical protein